MKTLFGIIGGIGVFIALIVGISFIKNNQEDKKKLVASSQLKENVLGTMVTSEEKIQEAQKLLSKKNSTMEDQARARSLIDEAVSDARKAAEMQPDNPRTWYYLSEMYQKLQKVNPKAVQFSIDALNKAIPLAPKDANLLLERASMYIFQEKYNEAEKDLQIAIKLDPTKANYYYKWGNVSKELGKYDTAKAAYLQAKELTLADNKMGHAQIDYQLKELEKDKLKEK